MIVFCRMFVLMLLIFTAVLGASELAAQDQIDTAGTAAGIIATFEAGPREALSNARATLRSVVDIPREFEDIASALTQGEGSRGLAGLAARFAAVLIGAILGERILRIAATRFGRKEAGKGASTGSQSIGWGIGEVASLGAFILLIFALGLYVFSDLEGSDPRRVFAAAYLAAIVVTRLAYLSIKLLLALNIAGTRVVKLDNRTSRFLLIWGTVVFAVGSGVFFTTGFEEIVGVRAPVRALISTAGALMTAGLLVFIVWAARGDVELAIRGKYTGMPEARFRRMLAPRWHVLATAYIAIAFLFAFYGTILGVPRGDNRVWPILGTLGLLLLLLVLDSAWRELAAFWSHKRKGKFANATPAISESAIPADPDSTANNDQDSPLIVALQRVGRMVLVVATLVALLFVWRLNVVEFGRTDAGGYIVRVAINIAAVTTIAYGIWAFVSVAISTGVPPSGHEDASAPTPATRLRTLLPLIRIMLLTTILVIAGMVVLSSLGIAIGPILAGASVVGIAIGFGAQRLVADIISGIFFLADDAFRVGEYIDTGEVKGTVEKISVRSVQLRHHRGALHTIPFGEIRHVTNYHRDWAVIKLEFRVPYDTDIEKVRKILKAEGREMMADPVLGPDMMEPLKSQGVVRMEDSALVLRAKFMAVPGRQFLIRREAFRRIQTALRNAGIEFAHRRVSVDLPPELAADPRAVQIAGATAQRILEEEGHPPESAGETP